MSRKHFAAIAASIADIRDENERREVALTCCAAFSLVSQRFDRKRFLSACKI